MSSPGRLGHVRLVLGQAGGQAGPDRQGLTEAGQAEVSPASGSASASLTSINQLIGN